jgi:hypothetical protein
VLLPAAAIATAALALARIGDPALTAGALSIAVAPAPLAALGIVTRLGGRGDLTGALVVGTAILSMVLVGAWGALVPGSVIAAIEAYVTASLLASALPPLRDALLGPLRLLGWAAVAVTLLAFVLAGPTITPESAAAAAALFVSGVLCAGLLAAIQRRDGFALVAGAGLRDPVIAGIAAVSVAGPPALAAPVVYAALSVGAVATRWWVRRAR